jgi:predicted transcriptional regulator
MDIQAEKLEIMKMLLEVDSPEILSEVKAVFQSQEYDFYNGLPQEVKLSIEAGLADAEKGNLYTHESVMKEMQDKHGLNY